MSIGSFLKRQMTTTRAAALAALMLVLIGMTSALVVRSSAVSKVIEVIRGSTDTGERFESPRLAALAKQLSAGNAGSNRIVLERFWDEMLGKAPLIEPVDGDKQSSWLTFLWRGNEETHRVHVLNGPAMGLSGIWLTHLSDTDLWFRTERVPNNSRFIYWFQVNWPVTPPKSYEDELELMRTKCQLLRDPLNSRGALGSPPGSLAELPEAPPRPWTDPLPGAPKGKVLEHKIKSHILAGQTPGVQQERTLMVYRPPNYDPGGERCSLLLFFDGQGFGDELMPIPIILDQLIAQKRITPTVAVFVFQSRDRDKELSCSEPFADFVAKEVVPWVRKNYHVSPDPRRTIVSGISTGGLMAGYCGFRHAGVFGNVLSLSGAYFWYPGVDEGTAPLKAEPGWLTRQFVTSPRLPVRFYLAAGRFEIGPPPTLSLLGENRRLRDVLEAKGYSVRYREFSGGHDAFGWRGPLIDGLIALSVESGRDDGP
jgi:enterochelin esterase-like enzyme